MLDLRFEKAWEVSILKKKKDSEPGEGRGCILFLWVYSVPNIRFNA